MNPGYHQAVQAHSVACKSYLTLQKAMQLCMENLEDADQTYSDVPNTGRVGSADTGQFVGRFLKWTR